ncbi:hypothetical protein ACIHFD_18040 [Nonomuraea sp. NPDC051941]|uniref:hypothetical protein n=1 Tax=Nonomuraea sp. NPDC051941 TaxID=3364373 RepID=UPI0037C86B65
MIRTVVDLLDKTSRMRLGRSWDDPALEQVLPQVKAGRLEPGLELINQARGDNELRALRVEQLAIAGASHTETLGRLAGDNADGLLWLGAARIEQAWAIRGAFRAPYVGEERFARFWEVLASAAGPLEQAAEALPDDPVPWDRLQWHGIGMQSGREELDRIWKELTARDPHLYLGHYSRVQALCAKWYGSDEELLAFVRGVTASARAGDPVTATGRMRVPWTPCTCSVPRSTSAGTSPARSACWRVRAGACRQSCRGRRRLSCRDAATSGRAGTWGFPRRARSST